MLGVTVLVVVMAVYSGLERNVKERLLGYTPHVLLNHPDGDLGDGRMTDWAAAAERAKMLRFVESATPYVSDYVLIDVASAQRPVLFRGIDTSDGAQVEGISKMLDLKNYPGSSADLGLDDRAVISSILAKSLGLGIGDKIRLYSTRNFEEVMKVYKSTENPPLRESYAADWKAVAATLTNAWKPDGDKFILPIQEWRDSYEIILKFLDEPIRKPEIALLTDIWEAMDKSEKLTDPADPDNTDKGSFRFDAEGKAKIEAAVAAIESADKDKMDAETFKSLKNIILPREAEVIGVYQASQMAVTPDVFVPLHLAQGLAGLGDSVQGIALRLSDPYLAESFKVEAQRALGPEWSLVTWGEQARDFFRLIEQQRAMMYFVLSMIVVISAFSMMAVMFTITIQKRREIGVMKALGAAPGQIVRVFLYQGMILGTLGAILGVGMGRVVIHFRGALQVVLRRFGFDPFTASFTGFDTLPAHNNPKEQVAFAIMAFILCSLAALVPAYFAARSDAAKSLRNL